MFDVEKLTEIFISLNDWYEIDLKIMKKNWKWNCKYNKSYNLETLQSKIKDKNLSLEKPTFIQYNCFGDSKAKEKSL